MNDMISNYVYSSVYVNVCSPSHNATVICRDPYVVMR